MRVSPAITTILLGLGAVRMAIGAPDLVTFTETVQPFFEAHCIKCHGPKKSKGGLRFDKIDGHLALARDIETWGAIAEQLGLGEMPPEDEKRPARGDLEKVIAWISGEMEKAGVSGEFRHKREQFAFGNLVDHDALFSGEIKALPSSPPRLWRLNPNVYDKVKKRVLLDHWEELQKARQPFLIEDRGGIIDYAANQVADSATLETLLRNARRIVDFQFKHEVPEALRVFLEVEKPSEEQVADALRHQFQVLLSREPTPDELKRYMTLTQGAIAKSDPLEGIRVGMKAIALSPEAIYRMELGLGATDEHGRTMLSADELVFSIAYALTDSPPDDALRAAARSRKLSTRDDVHREVTRLLDDDAIAKPRLLRFFQEFFGYHRAGRIFKDEKRYRNYFWGNVAAQVIHEADLLVLSILERDQDVLKELLTTKKFYVGHYGPSMKAQELETRLVAMRRFYEHWKDKDYKDMVYELKPGVREEIEALHPYFLTQPMNHRINGDMIKFYMPYLGMCYENGIRPMLVVHEMMAGYRERNLTFAGDHRSFLGTYNLDEQSFDCPTEQPFVLNPQQRAGLLTHPAWLISHSVNTETNPITRGKWVRERLLAGRVPDIPITVNAVVPEDPEKTLRQRFAATKQSECWRCHRKMNPLGMSFEMFDDFGRFRTIDEVSKRPIDASGALDSTGDEELDGEVENAIELVHRLAESDRVRQSFVRHAFRYWMGRNERLNDSKTLIAADNAYTESGGSFKALLVSLLTSDSFLYRKELP